MLSWILILLGGGFLVIKVVGKIWPLVQKYIPSAAPQAVTSVIEKADDYTDIVACLSANFAITAIAKKRGATALASEAAAMRVTIAKLADNLTTPMK